MQTDNKELYKLTSERTGKSEQIYKEIGNFVFSELYTNLRRPTTLIFKLKGVGFWYLRKRRMEIILKDYPVDPNKTRENFKTDLEFYKYENKRELHQIFAERLKDYERYLNLRNSIRSERNEDKTLLESTNKED